MFNNSVPECCLSLVGDKRNLDLEYDTPEARDQQLAGFLMFIAELKAGRDRYIDDIGVIRRKKEILVTLQCEELRLLTESTKFTSADEVAALNREIELAGRDGGGGGGAGGAGAGGGRGSESEGDGSEQSEQWRGSEESGSGSESDE